MRSCGGLAPVLVVLLLQAMPRAGEGVDRLSAAIFKFIYNNEQTCGDQFRDEAWMPAHDLCNLDCDLISEICQISTRRGLTPSQKCQALPPECAFQLKTHLRGLGLAESRRADSKRSGEVTLSATTGGAFQYGFSTALPVRATTQSWRMRSVTVTSAPEDEEPLNGLEGLARFSEDDSSSSEEKTRGELTDWSDADSDFEDPTSTNSIFASQVNPFEQNTPPTDFGQTSTERFFNDDFKDNRLEMPSAVPTPPSEVHIFGPPFTEKARSSAIAAVVTTQPPRHLPATMDELNRLRSKPPWSWNKLAERVKKPWSLGKSEAINNMLAVNRPQSDLSARCCQWALDGLCDRSWQRVRVMCPKSCGSVVCSSVDGAMSCNRAVDVDVVECYERRRTRLSQVRGRFFRDSDSLEPLSGQAEDEPRSGSHERREQAWAANQRRRAPPSMLQYRPAVVTRGPPRALSTAPHRAFAVENEISQFRRYG